MAVVCGPNLTKAMPEVTRFYTARHRGLGAVLRRLFVQDSGAGDKFCSCTLPASEGLGAILFTLP